jgi:hypothetical protein
VTVAALYVDPKGVYAGLPDVEVWDEARDARNYAGPWPVVAHPPCQRWSQLASLVEAIYGYKIGDDGGCFEAALRSVRKFGGVLEHPAESLAWPRFGLPRPGRYGWSQSLWDEGWVTEIAQVAYGHEAQKRTWLYYCGESLPPTTLDWSMPPATAEVGGFGGKTRPILRNGQSSYTPSRLRDVLLGMAKNARATAVPP